MKVILLNLFDNDNDNDNEDGLLLKTIHTFSPTNCFTNDIRVSLVRDSFSFSHGKRGKKLITKGPQVHVKGISSIHCHKGRCKVQVWRNRIRIKIFMRDE